MHARSTRLICKRSEKKKKKTKQMHRSSVTSAIRQQAAEIGANVGSVCGFGDEIARLARFARLA